MSAAPTKSPEPVILPSSPEAAKPHTMNGWLSRNGVFFQDERTARYAGSTHAECTTCGKPAERPYVKCRGCRDVVEAEKFAAMPRAKWDGGAMLYSEARDVYFNSPGDAEDSLDTDETLADLRLVICTPNYVRRLEGDYCCDEQAEDGELPGEVEEAMDAFNKAVAGVVLSWSPGKTALALDTEAATSSGENSHG